MMDRTKAANDDDEESHEHHPPRGNNEPPPSTSTSTSRDDDNNDDAIDDKRSPSPPPTTTTTHDRPPSSPSNPNRRHPDNDNDDDNPVVAVSLVTASSSSGASTSAGTASAAASALTFTKVSSSAAGSHLAGNNNVGNHSSSSESEHLATTATAISMSTTIASSPSLSSSAIAPSNDIDTSSIAMDNNIPSSSLPRLHSTKTATPKKSHYNPPPALASRPSSLSSKSRGSQGSSGCGGPNKPHAYFASSEEESEAELDEKDSDYGHHHHHNDRQLQQRHGGGGAGGKGAGASKSSLRGSRKLTEIASLHSSPRVRMNVPQNESALPAAGGPRKESIGSSTTGDNSGISGSNNKPIIASIYRTATSGRDGGGGGVPPPPQTVTIAVGNNGAPTDVIAAGPAAVPLPPGGVSSPSSRSSQPRPPSSSLAAASALSSPACALGEQRAPRERTMGGSACPVPAVGIVGGALPPRKRVRKKRRHRHLPRGLPVFKDPRSCMWTSTHDANAPSEDRYSSLVNVLLRPPKTPRGEKTPLKKNEGGNCGGDGKKGGKAKNNGDNNGNTDGIGNSNINEENQNGNNNINNEVGSKSGSSGDGSYSAEEEENEQQNSQSTLPHNNAGNATNSNNNNSTNGEDDEDNTSLIRLSLWSVIDGHGGGCVATYAAEVLLPHIAASVARALKSEIVDRGVCNVNGQLRDANALDLDGLIRSSDRSRPVGKSQVRQREAGIDVVNPNSIHYRSPYEDSESEGDIGVDHVSRRSTGVGEDGRGRVSHHFDDDEETSAHHHMRSESESEAESEAPGSVASSLLPGNPIASHGESVSSVKTSIKMAVSPATQHAPVGTHSPAEVASITRAITDSFLAVDEGWINSIDPVTTHQTSCVSNGRWNAGACALVVFIVQRLDWCRSSRVDHETHHWEGGARGFEDTSHNKDAARRRKLDYATKSKSVSSLSDLSSTSSITTEANTTGSMLVEESEITETEDDGDVSDIFGPGRRKRKKGSGHHHHHHHHIDDAHIATPLGCSHYYRPHDAMLYTAHVGDCRAVMLGSAPPRTIKVPPEVNSSLSLDHADTSEDENSSVSIAGNISSSEHDSDSSGDMMEDEDNHFLRGGRGRGGAGRGVPGGATGMLGYVRRAAKRQRRNEKAGVYEQQQPFVPLPPLERRHWSSEESAVESDDSMSTTAQEHLPPVGSIVRTVVQGPSVVRAGGLVVTGPGGALDHVVDHPHVDPRVVVTGARPVRGAFGNLEEDRGVLETEDEETEDEIKDMRSVRSGSPTQMDRPPSPTQLVADPVHPPPLPLSMLMRPIDLTTDHSAYNPAEVTAVKRRCNNAPKAISSASSGGIKRVAGSLAVTRALGDAYLKTPRLSFFPYKRHAPYITARPEVNCRVLTKGADRILTLASDGVWERASGDDVLRWVRNYYNARIAGVKEQHLHGSMYDNLEERLHDPYGDMEEHEKGMSSRGVGRKHGASGNRLVNEGNALGGGGNALGHAETAAGGGSKDGRTSVQEKALSLKPPPAAGDTSKQSADGVVVGPAAACKDHDKVEDSDAATTSETTGTTTAVEQTSASTPETGAKTGSAKRKHHGDGSSASAVGSVSSRGSGSTVSSTRGTLRETRSMAAASRHRHRHLCSTAASYTRPYSLSIPKVSEVIVRKVLNKVRKTRNISSLRMLMSLPKGRARRSKHDDITATVVDLSGFVS